MQVNIPTPSLKSVGLVILGAVLALGFGVGPRHVHWPHPAPPAPAPAPAPAPIDGPGLRVLVVYESSELSKYPASQASGLFDRSLRSYLDGVTPAGPGGAHEWRVFDKDVDASAESPAWQAAMKRPRATLPWIVISNGKTGFEGPLPPDAAGTIALVRKYEVKP